MLARKDSPEKVFGICPLDKQHRNEKALIGKNAMQASTKMLIRTLCASKI